MSKYFKTSFLIIIAELILIFVFNIFYANRKNEEEAYYRVEVARLESELLKGQDVDTSKYKTITGYKEFDPEEICNEEYVVKNINGKLYRITYKRNLDSVSGLYFNLCLAGMVLVSVVILGYIYFKLIKPFYKISNMTVELAKGNLSNPVKQEKSKFLGKFLWGVDMLRDNLEDSKNRNLQYQKEKKTIILSLSHDIKTPLAAINLYVKGLLNGLYENKAEEKEALMSVLDKTSEIKSYVDDIYSYTRDDFMNFEVNVSEVYMSEVIDKIYVYYSDKLRVLHTSFEIDTYDNCILSADPDRLVECIQNLMENAVKYGDGKQISISFDDEEDCKLITVSNSGCSLNDDEIGNIFDSFYRGSNTGNIQGNGLGLYIVKKLMRLSGGDVYAKCDKERDTFAATLVVKKV